MCAVKRRLYINRKIHRCLRPFHRSRLACRAQTAPARARSHVSTRSTDVTSDSRTRRRLGIDLARLGGESHHGASHRVLCIASRRIVNVAAPVKRSSREGDALRVIRLRCLVCCEDLLRARLAGLFAETVDVRRGQTACKRTRYSGVPSLRPLVVPRHAPRLGWIYSAHCATVGPTTTVFGHSGLSCRAS